MRGNLNGRDESGTGKRPAPVNASLLTWVRAGRHKVLITILLLTEQNGAIDDRSEKMPISLAVKLSLVKGRLFVKLILGG